jgi:hypothetical protein
VQSIFIKKYFLFTIGSVCRIKPLTTGSRISSKMFGSRRWCPISWPCWDCDRNNCAAGGKVDSSWEQDSNRQCNNCTTVFPWFSIQHNAWSFEVSENVCTVAIWLDRPCSVQRVSPVQLRVRLWSVNQRATEAEESPSPRFVTRKRLVKILQRNSHCGERLPNKD